MQSCLNSPEDRIVFQYFWEWDQSWPGENIKDSYKQTYYKQIIPGYGNTSKGQDSVNWFTSWYHNGDNGYWS